jgi:hypothetical protein
MMRKDGWSPEAREAAAKAREAMTGKNTGKGKPPASASERSEAWRQSRDLRQPFEERQKARKFGSTGY